MKTTWKSETSLARQSSTCSNYYLIPDQPEIRERLREVRHARYCKKSHQFDSQEQQGLEKAIVAHLGHAVLVHVHTVLVHTVLVHTVDLLDSNK